MRYMMLVKGNKDYEAGIPPKKELMEASPSTAQRSRRRASFSTPAD